MVKSKVLCFGELLLRISPGAHHSQADNQPMIMYIGGAEANVATALAKWNVPVKYCTVLPDNFVSHHMISYLESKGIENAAVLSGNKRIGIYYLEKGADLKGSVVYDRDHSSFSEIKRGTIDWEKILADVSWLNFSAISPALNEQVADVCLEALEAAKKKNITISLDLNYRSRLWKYGKQPQQVMPALVEYCDVIMGNIWSANSLLGIPVDEHIHDKRSKHAYLDHAKFTSREIMKLFPKCKIVANTFRFDDEHHEVLYHSCLHINDQQYQSNELKCNNVVDRSGSGDCFMAGLIYGLYNSHEPQDILNYASAAAVRKLQEPGDATNHDKAAVLNTR